MKNFRSSLKRITPQSIKEYPWLSIAIFLGIAWYILTKLGNSATWLGDVIRNFTNPDTSAIQQHNENNFDASHRSLNAQQLLKVRADARSLSVFMGTYKGSTWFNRRYFVLNDSTVFNVIKDYTNPLMIQGLDQAYASLYTDNRDYKADVTDFCRADSITYLQAKHIL
jgi:hypothetical protein